MGIRNDSERDVEYEVEPSDPGVANPVLISAVLTGTGAAAMALGCLTDVGGPGLTVAGLFLLVAALAGETYAYGKVTSAGAALLPTPATGGKKLLAKNGGYANHTFAPGTWVVFYEKGAPIAVSPPVYKQNATVVLRRCVDAAAMASPDEAHGVAQMDHVDLEPPDAAGLA